MISGFDGTVRVWDLERNEPAGLVWDGPGVRLASSPSWYDEAGDSIWVFMSGRLLEIPLNPERWIERACDVVGRDLTSEKWGRCVPATSQVEDSGGEPVGGGDPRSACP